MTFYIVISSIRMNKRFNKQFINEEDGTIKSTRK